MARRWRIHTGNEKSVTHNMLRDVQLILINSLSPHTPFPSLPPSLFPCLCMCEWR